MRRDEVLTTYQAADALGCEADAALAVLKGAGVPHERVGIAYLWDRRAVLRLKRLLRPPLAGKGGDW